MKKTIKTSEIINMYGFLNGAKFTTLKSESKIKFWKIMRALKPTVESYNDAMKSATESMKPEGDFDAKLEKFNEYQRLTREGKSPYSVMSLGEFNAFTQVLEDFNKLVFDATKDIREKDVEVEFEPMNDEDIIGLVSENGWNVAQGMYVADSIGE